RPGPPGPRVAGARWAHTDCVGSRGVPIRPRPGAVRAARLEPRPSLTTTTGGTMAIADITFWDCITIRDTEAMLAFLTALGFTEHACHRDESDPSVITHAEWISPEGTGGLMFGTEREGATGSSAA